MNRLGESLEGYLDIWDNTSNLADRNITHNLHLYMEDTFDPMSSEVMTRDVGWDVLNAIRKNS